ncbi:MAG: hypothetical protein M3O87_00080 [Candidatus Dormibacteraeota bacterium]|nr:hypothetical protein [Candidatus Dormibacteraeota bacterium]
MNDIESRLSALSSDVAWPTTPDFGTGLRRRLARPEGPARRRDQRPTTWRRVAVVAAVVLAIVAAALAIPPAREGLARLFGIRGVSIQRQQSPIPSATAGNQLDRGLLGGRTSLSDAARVTGITIRPPSLLGAPDEVRTRKLSTTTAITMVYNPRADLPDPNGTGVGMLITVFRAGVDKAFFGKIVGPGTQIDEVQLASGTGYWIHGSPHAVVIRLANGDPALDELRLSQDTLLWQEGDVTYRLESALGRDDAVRIANSMR